MNQFIGRQLELTTLKRIKNKKKASLVCIMGRRRIGKSALVQEFGKTFSSMIEVQGLAPEHNNSLSDQLSHFAQSISDHFNIKRPYFEDWEEAFLHLAKLTRQGQHLIFLDEISWMAQGDPLFSAKFKSAWDIHFKKNPLLVIVLCGSVSSWIEENLLKNASFEGRISLEINLQELSLIEINQFWKAQNSHMGSLEKMMILSVTGGVPKYLEEVLQTESASQNLAHLCFSPGGILFNDYQKIFQDIFQRKTRTLEKIIRTCLVQKFSPAQLAQKMGVDQDSDLSKNIRTLELSGFLSRDYYFKPDSGEVAKLSHLRVKDNYLRFYLKVIEPLKAKIEKGGKIVTVQPV